MLQSEFEKFLGRLVTEEEFAKANAVYLASTLNIEQFCNEWEAVKDSKLVYDLQLMVSSYEDRCKELRKQLEDGGYVVTLRFLLDKDDYTLQVWSKEIPSYSYLIATAKKLHFEKKPVTEAELREKSSIVSFVKLNKYEFENFKK
jgi:hypothetical protein